MFKEIPANNISKAARKPIYGVGINDAEYMVLIQVNGKSVRCPAYSIWIAMLQRGYSARLKEKRPTYVGVTVCKEWLLFSNFKKWYDKNFVSGYFLDKDIKIKGNKVYSPAACLFVPSLVNNSIIDSVSRRGNYQLGVSYNKKHNSYQSRVHHLGKLRTIGSFKTEEEAHAAYKIGKNEALIATSNKYPEFAVYLKQYMYKVKQGL